MKEAEYFRYSVLWMLVRCFYGFLVKKLCAAAKSKRQDDNTFNFPLKGRDPVVTRGQHCCRQEGFLREVSTQRTTIQHQTSKQAPRPLTHSINRYWILFNSDFKRPFLIYVIWVALGKATNCICVGTEDNCSEVNSNSLGLDTSKDKVQSWTFSPCYGVLLQRYWFLSFSW